MFKNPQVALNLLPSADDVEWESLDPRFALALRMRATAVLVGITIALAVLTVVGPGVLPHALLWAGLVAVAVVLYGWPALSLPRRGYALRARDILFRKGVLWRSVTAVPFNRIQHVETGSAPLDRRLGLATLSLYTAGGSGSDLRIDGLAVDVAERLRGAILEKTGSSVETA